MPKIAYKGVIGIPDELVPPEGLLVATDEEILEAFKQGAIGKVNLPVQIIERTTVEGSEHYY